MNKVILIPKNISALRRLAKHSTISFAGLEYDIRVHHAKNYTERTIVLTDKIKEYQAILKTAHSCVIGLSTSIEQFINLTETEIPLPLLRTCLLNSYSSDLWHISIMEALFNTKRPSSLYLLFAMINAEVQVMTDSSITWLSFKSLLEEKGTSLIENKIPIKIRFNLFNKTAHYCMVPQNPFMTYNQSFFHLPVIMGQVELKSNDEINDIRFLYANKNNVLDLSSTLIKYKGKRFPLHQDEVIQIWEDYDFIHVEEKHISYIKQSFMTLFAPSFV